MTAPDAHRAIDAVWKFESTKIIAGLTGVVRDVGLAEEFAQDALVAALEQWPRQGIPDNPGAWLMTTAKRRAIDHIRRNARLEDKQKEIARTLEQQGSDEHVDDDVLRLMFMSCHPVLPPESRTALTLRLLGGLTAGEIARAFLVSEQTVTQRIADAKRTLAEKRIPFELPPRPELADRLASVLEVVYLIFNEGYAATSGDDLMRPTLCLEALRLGRLLADLAPRQAEVHGLVALMELHASRSAARTGPSGEPVQLHEQNRGRWDQLLVRRGFAAMLRAREIGDPPGPYVLQAAIAVHHAQAKSAEDTDWPRIAALYGALVRQMPSPVVQLNRAIALGMAHGPQVGLDVVDQLVRDPALKNYHLLSGVRGDLLARLGRHDEATREFERAASLTHNAAERAFLRRRAAAGAPPRVEATLGQATREFLAREDLDPETVRSYGQTLRRLCLDLGPKTPLVDITAGDVLRVFAVAWGTAAPKTWNRHRAAVRSFRTWASVDDLSAELARKPESRTRRAPIALPQLETLCEQSDTALREQTLWWLLYESTVSAKTALSLDIEDLDLPRRHGQFTRGSESHRLSWQSGTAVLLPRLVEGRCRGPLFLADRRPAPSRMPRSADLCPDTGRGRLSYERAEYLFKRATKRLDPSGAGYTLHQLSRSGPRREDP
ncbi:RNA polymerase sigma factor [Embleya scabrispora]|uniref:RNA polymerase sigma factor n=1 Tax=Embleya scabrispora TaxID=159449 RepID=UPI00037A323F|nr:RNA polymerase sigma factor [Embleya scabrispora]